MTSNITPEKLRALAKRKYDNSPVISFESEARTAIIAASDEIERLKAVRMTDDTNVTKFRLELVGSGIKIDVDQILEEAKGNFVRIAMVCEREDGEIEVRGSDGAAESLMLLAWGQNFIVNNMV